MPHGRRARTTATRNGRTSRSASPDPRLDARGGEIQRFGTLRSLPIGLPATAKQGSCRVLNEILADTMVLYALYKKHHWNVAGPTFYQLHLLFDKHAEEQAELIDLLAERVQSLGGIAVGDPRHAAELTSIPRPPDGAEEVAVMIDRTLARPRDRDRQGPRRDRGDREGRGLGLERPADGRRPAPPRAPGLVPLGARRGRAAHRLTPGDPPIRRLQGADPGGTDEPGPSRPRPPVSGGSAVARLGPGAARRGGSGSPARRASAVRRDAPGPTRRHWRAAFRPCHPR